MSITFELLEAVEVFPLAKLRERSGLPELECSELIGEELSAAFLSNISHVYLPGVTCFSPELSYDKSSRHYSVRMVASSCSVDYDLAFEIITALSSTKHSRVSCGEDRGTPVSELRSVYTADWVASQIEGAFEYTVKIGKSALVSTHGAIREFYFGPRMFEEISRLPTREEQKREFYRRVLEIQYVPEQYFSPKVYVLKDRKKTFSIIGPDVRYFFPSVQFFVLVGEDRTKPWMFIPYDKVTQLQTKRIQLIDERQGLLEPIPKEEWPAFVEAARPFALPIAETPG